MMHTTERISQELVEELREAVLFSRDRAGLGLSRQEISMAAGIRGSDLDNFTTKQRSSGRFKTQRPHERIVQRLLKFVATDPRVTQRLAEDTGHLRLALGRLRAAYQALPAYSPDDDHFFIYLNRIHAMDEKRCLSVCSKLEGNYFGYRFSGSPGRLVRSHFEVKAFDPTRKTPNFVHHLRYDAGASIRRIEGQILDIGHNYIFTGFVGDSSFTYEGVKFLVMDKGEFGNPARLNGSFVSYIGQLGHQIGFIQLVKTTQKYSEDVLATDMSVDDAKAQDKNFEVVNLRRDVSSLLQGKNLVAALS